MHAVLDQICISHAAYHAVAHPGQEKKIDLGALTRSYRPPVIRHCELFPLAG